MPIARDKRHARWLAFTALVWGASTLFGQPAPSNPDILLFADGEKLTGHFVQATGSTVTFHSDALGDVTVDWKKVKELTSTAKVAVIPKGVRIRKPAQAADIPQGTLTVQDQQVHLAAPTPPTAQAPIPLSGTNTIISQAGFEKALRHVSFLQDWTGTVTVGVAVVNATQDSESFTGALSLVRAVPSENWLEPRNKTILDLSDSYGQVSQPATPTIKTSIFHGDAERDEYFSQRLFAFGQGAFDHNYSQGLDLQQTYSGGLGWTLIQSGNQTLDVKGSASYIRQQFMGAPNQNLVGSIFGEDFNRKFKHMTLDQHLTLTPTWNNTSDYAAAFNALLTVPMYKRLNGSAGFIETFLNDPPPGFRKNAVQITLGITYTVQ